ncbi:uncharacterized protein LOC131947846 isoform X2 [Physella acuta]|uniref:uncharacterized protein LOC131947846 isoform X2 n=2 Tax=Physella acuta TaxID=109671 RepID=UPI0027DE05D9|nr:uncharacterized protein LOC131947846 isoform X2 [Physella acuta]
MPYLSNHGTCLFTAMPYCRRITPWFVVKLLAVAILLFTLYLNSKFSYPENEGNFSLHDHQKVHRRDTFFIDNDKNLDHSKHVNNRPHKPVRWMGIEEDDEHVHNINHIPPHAHPETTPHRELKPIKAPELSKATSKPTNKKSVGINVQKSPDNKVKPKTNSPFKSEQDKLKAGLDKKTRQTKQTSQVTKTKKYEKELTKKPVPAKTQKPAEKDLKEQVKRIVALKQAPSLSKVKVAEKKPVVQKPVVVKPVVVKPVAQKLPVMLAPDKKADQK